jgi:hypothetical protein
MPDEEGLIPLIPVTRPDGRIYRPRKIVACAVADEDELLSGVVVLGTHDAGRAQPLADAYACWQLGTGYVATDPETGWFREGYEAGRPMWVRDENKGRAGVFFHGIAEVPPGTADGGLSHQSEDRHGMRRTR